MSFSREMSAGQAHAEQRAWSSAYASFQRAHDLGHGVRAEHLAARQSALHAAWHGRRLDRIIYQVVFLGFATLTSWGSSPGPDGPVRISA